jgi:hypothetical protein
MYCDVMCCDRGCDTWRWWLKGRFLLHLRRTLSILWFYYMWIIFLDYRWGSSVILSRNGAGRSGRYYNPTLCLSSASMLL